MKAAVGLVAVSGRMALFLAKASVSAASREVAELGGIMLFNTIIILMIQATRDAASRWSVFVLIAPTYSGDLDPPALRWNTDVMAFGLIGSRPMC